MHLISLNSLPFLIKIICNVKSQLIKIESPSLSPPHFLSFLHQSQLLFNIFGCISWYHLTFAAEGAEPDTKWILCK